ncbi:pyridoxal phosphate-dependent decarboxylase family protein [Dactylosporangium darangshiense]|uniref:Pyridoxal-dependent decarboxylase n=1 Tax=Dactylosporangium darangshiense TaxID=579108 RepID=A0ABP8DW11_9ACTN
MTLGLDDEDRRTASRLLAEFFDRYEQSVATAPIVPQVDRDVLAGLLADPFPDKGIGVEGLFRAINEKILPNSTKVAHPRFLAYVQGPPNGVAPYAEAIAATINQNCNFWQLSPAASVIERAVVSWLAGLFGYGEASGGILTSGGSVASLHALTTALHERRPEFRAAGLQTSGPALVVYTSGEAHRCIDKAVAILGLGLDNVRHIATDSGHRMRVDALAEAVRADRAAGREPFCVVATTGTVMSGAIDPIGPIADLCEREGLWLHIDGAYGGLFVLADRVHPAFDDCRRADSIALDPHKLLFAPLEAGCLLVRDRANLARAYAFKSAYLTVEDDPLMVDYMDFGPQLSRGFKALKVWSALQAFGVDSYRGVIDQVLQLAEHLRRRVEEDPNLELMAPVTLSAVCFRIKGWTEAQHAAVRATLAEDGTALLGPARLGGRHGLRACVTNYRTTYADIDLVVDRISELASCAS